MSLMCRAGSLSIQRLGGSRPRLRRTRPYGISIDFGVAGVSRPRLLMVADGRSEGFELVWGAGTGGSLRTVSIWNVRWVFCQRRGAARLPVLRHVSVAR